jgi:sn-glycerol 3-phosphate transport system permease protein
MTKVKSDIPANTLQSPRRKKIHIGRLVLPYAMVLPTIILLGVFTFYPSIDMVINSFYDVNPFKGNTYVGFANYEKLFQHPEFWPSVKNTLIYTVGSVVFLIVLGLVFALWLQRSTFINGIAHRLMFLPHLCSGLTIAMVWSWLLDEQGMFNLVLSWFNVGPLKWLNDSDTSLISIMIVNFWKGVGYYALIMLSAVKSIPTELLEAADLDNSGKIRTFFKITLPMVSPQIFFLVITITMNSFKVFDSVRLMTGGGPNGSSDVLVYYIYRQAMENSKTGLASAAGVILMLILLVMNIIYFRSMSKKVHYQ